MSHVQQHEIIRHPLKRGHKMRRKFNPQMNLFTATSSNPIARELEQVSQILDANPQLLDLVYQDLVKAKRHDTGREGLTAEQVLRCAVLKQYRQLSYEELTFHLDDSSAFRSFFPPGDGRVSLQVDSSGEHQILIGRDLGGDPQGDHRLRPA